MLNRCQHLKAYIYRRNLGLLSGYACDFDTVATKVLALPTLGLPQSNQQSIVPVGEVMSEFCEGMMCSQIPASRLVSRAKLPTAG